MNKTEEHITKHLRDRNITYGKTITNNINYEEEFNQICQKNYCGKYEKTWSCISDSKIINSLKNTINNYQKIIVFSLQGKMEDDFDLDSMNQLREEIMEHAYNLKRELQIANLDALILGAGSCSLCRKCTYPEFPCKHPELMIYPLELLGINVLNLVKSSGLNYYNGKQTVTYFCAIFY